MKRREGLESRCSDPGRERDNSRSGSRSKRKSRDPGHASGTKSAPVSRGADNGTGGELLWPPEPPMTEPGRPSQSQMMRPNSSVNLGGMTPMRCTSQTSLHMPSSSTSVRRPPHMPTRRSGSTRRLGEYSPSCSPADGLEEESPCGMTPHARHGRSAVSGASGASPSRGPKRSSSRSNLSGYPGCPNAPVVPELPLGGHRNDSVPALNSAKSSTRSTVRSGRGSRSENSLPLASPGGRSSPALPPRDLTRDLSARSKSKHSARAERSQRGESNDKEMPVAPQLPGSTEQPPTPVAARRDGSSNSSKLRKGRGDNEVDAIKRDKHLKTAAPEPSNASEVSPVKPSMADREKMQADREKMQSPATTDYDPSGSVIGDLRGELRHCLGQASGSTALPSASNTAESALENGTIEVKDNGWDEGDGDSGAGSLSNSLSNGGGFGKASASRSHLSSLNCIRGSKGAVTSLMMSLNNVDEATSHSRQISKHSLGESSFLNGTMSSPDAVKGHTGVAWVRGEEIGHGTLGSVFKALDQKTGMIFAVKEVRIDSRDKADVKFKQALENEVSIYKELHHERIVQYMGHDTLAGSLYIYLEYMPGGSVTQVLGQFGAFDESLITTYTRDLLEGLEYLHTRDPVVLHRDVKGANILVGLDCRVKLSDFGCSKRTADTLSQSLRGSIPWMAPEVIQQTGYGRRSDVWSLGCVVIEMATAQHPWGSFDNPMAAMVKIGMSAATPPLPSCVSELCQNFISLCVQRDKNLRPTATECLKHEFVQIVSDSFA